MTNHSKNWLKTAVGIALLVIGSILPPARLAAQPLAVAQDEPDGPVYLDGQVLIQFKPGATDAELLDGVRQGALNVNVHRRIHTDAMKAAGHPGISVMQTGLPVRQAIQALKNHPAVESVEPNWVYTHQDISNDPYYTGGFTWGLYGDLTSPANQFGSQAAEAWAAGHVGDSTVYVGVIDEGIQISHPDLAANVWTNPHEIPGDGIDNDGNGYIDDVNGWDFFENNNSIYDGTGDDHGTHVTGTIAAKGGNGLGVAGVNWNVTYISGKFLGPSGGSTADAVEAIDYFSDLKTRHSLNIVALNNSWGGGGFSQALLDAIVRAANKDILFMAAAGNAGSNNDTTAFYPARYDTTTGAGYNSVIAVAAIQSNGALASFSNYGNNTVHLGAPGVGTWSTVPTDAYASYSGTSMATPHVTGAAALYASTHPGATAPQIRDAILSSVAATASLDGKTITGGRLDLSTVIVPSDPPETPAAPTGLRAVAGNSQVSLAWVGSPGASSYKVKRSNMTGGPYTTIFTVTTTSYIDTSAVNDTTYYYVVSAVNLHESVPSAEVSATPGPPAAPTGLSAAAISRSQINLTWADKSNNEDVFKIERAGNNKFFSQIATTAPDQNSFSDTTVSRNTTYYYRVRASNAVGNSGYSNTASAKTPKN